MSVIQFLFSQCNADIITLSDDDDDTDGDTAESGGVGICITPRTLTAINEYVHHSSINASSCANQAANTALFTTATSGSYVAKSACDSRKRKATGGTYVPTTNPRSY